MTTKEFLEQGMYLDLEIRTKKEEITKLEGIAKRIKEGKRVRNKMSIDVMEDVICEYTEGLVKDITKLIYIKHSIVQGINKLVDSRDRSLLTLRYVDFKTWQEISDELGYSLSQVQRIHNTIVDEMKIDI